MAKPSSVTLSKKDQKSVLSRFKSGVASGRKIAVELGFPRRQVMAVLEENGLASYSEGSYN